MKLQEQVATTLEWLDLTDEEFHRRWTEAHGEANYNKEAWNELQRVRWERSCDGCGPFVSRRPES